MGLPFGSLIRQSIDLRDFGSGPALSTCGKGHSIVLSAECLGCTSRVRLMSTDPDGLLTETAASPVLEHIVRLWNEHAAERRMLDAHNPAQATEPVRSVFTVEFPVKQGDRVLARKNGGWKSGVVGHLKAAVDGGGVSRWAYVAWTDGGGEEVDVEWVRLSNLPTDWSDRTPEDRREIDLGHRVMPAAGLSFGGSRGTITAMYLRDEVPPVRVTVRWDNGTVEGNIDPTHLRRAP